MAAGSVGPTHYFGILFNANLWASTGAPRVLVYHHGVRTSLQEGVKFVPGSWAKGGPRTPAPPVYTVHLDQSDGESHNIIRRHLPNEADALLRKRVVIVNVGYSMDKYRRIKSNPNSSGLATHQNRLSRSLWHCIRNLSPVLRPRSTPL